MIIQENISRQLVSFSIIINISGITLITLLIAVIFMVMVVPVGNSSFWEKLVDSGYRLYNFNYIGG